MTAETCEEVSKVPDGYRVLREGEIIKEGDIYFSLFKNQWIETPCLGAVVSPKAQGWFARNY